MNSNNDVEAAAAAWLVRRDRGDLSVHDQDEFNAWLRASTAHRVVFLRLEAAWQQADRLRALGAGVPAGAMPKPGEWAGGTFFHAGASGAPKLANQRRWRWPIGIAAVLAVAVIGIGLWYVEMLRVADYQTVVGGVQAVPLKDGSAIMLNTNSEVRVAVTDTERRVDLTRGEAFFHVAKDPKRPFVVRAGSSRVIAVGTQFSVRRDGNVVSVVVVEGRVRLERDGGSATMDPPTLLAAGAVARSDGAALVVQARPLPEAEQMLSWRNGYLTFHDTPLHVAVA
jgi:transmembrane sensor